MKRIIEEVLREAVRDAEEFYGWTKEKRAGVGDGGGRWEVGEGGAIDRCEKERWGRKGDFNVASLSIKMKSVVFIHSAIRLTTMRKISRGGEC